MDLIAFITSITIPFWGMNWIDVLILTVIIFYIIEGYSLGFFVAFIDLVSFILSFILGIAFYSLLANILIKLFVIPQGFSNAISFFIIAVLSELIFSLILKKLMFNIPLFSFKGLKRNPFKIVNQIFGIIPGLMSGFLLTAFILSLIISLPFSVFLKHAVSTSKIGNVLIAETQSFAKDWSNIFGGAVNDTLAFLTIEPKSNESVNLNFKTDNISIDLRAEQKMLQVVNRERTSRGFSQLAFSENLTKVARAHCRDMFAKGYFSHITPEGLTPFDRMAKSNIIFNYAGENLALAPNMELAMRGLMQSSEHRDNILSVNFNKAGMGIIDGGIYGEMFCQEFTD